MLAPPPPQARRDNHHLGAKYAAMLPLAAVDPTRKNKVAAAQLLRDFVVKRRQLAGQLVMKAAAEDASGAGSTLQEEPEMMLPYLLHLLAHHPDFPKVWLGLRVSMDAVCNAALSRMCLDMSGRYCCRPLKEHVRTRPCFTARTCTMRA